MQGHAVFHQGSPSTFTIAKHTSRQRRAPDELEAYRCRRVVEVCAHGRASQCKPHRCVGLQRTWPDVRRDPTWHAQSSHISRVKIVAQPAGVVTACRDDNLCGATARPRALLSRSAALPSSLTQDISGGSRPCRDVHGDTVNDCAGPNACLIMSTALSGMLYAAMLVSVEELTGEDRGGNAAMQTEFGCVTSCIGDGPCGPRGQRDLCPATGVAETVVDEASRLRADLRASNAQAAALRNQLASIDPQYSKRKAVTDQLAFELTCRSAGHAREPEPT
jgi:hypothetical protein